MDKATTFKLLEKSFSEEEWRFLVGQPVFIGLLAKEEWEAKDLEQLIQSGTSLLKTNNRFKIAKHSESSN